MVYTAFQRQGISRVDMRVTDNVLQVPLYGVYPTF